MRGGCTYRIHQDYDRMSPHSTTTLATSVRQIVAGCEGCHRIEAARYGVNTDQPCEGVTMDFVTDLPESTTSGYTDILVVVDRLTNIVIYLLYHKEVDSPELVRMLFEEVIYKHGVPSNIVVNRGSQFMSRSHRWAGRPNSRIRQWSSISGLSLRTSRTTG
jgi:hypothetical protein